VEPGFAELRRAALPMVDKRWLETLKEPRAARVSFWTAVVWVQLGVSWALALYGPLWMSAFSFIINCAMVQAMLLWTHEASHYGLTTNRRLNDLWCDIFFAGPIGITVGDYRVRHMTHHAHLGTDLDQDGYPYRFSIKGGRALGLLALKILSGQFGMSFVINKYVTLRVPVAGERTAAWSARLVTVVFNLALLGVCIAVGRWYLYFLLWLYPIVVIAILLNVVRTIAEHQPEDFPTYRDGAEIGMQPVARTTTPNPLEKWLMYQANFNFHVEHHLFPGIPHHNLGLLHRRLVDGGFYEQFPQCLQSSGIAKFAALARNRVNSDFSDPVADALSA
jgi:fatty acid desaturase